MLLVNRADQMLLTVDANAICERSIGTLRRECLDCVIPLNDRYLYRILKEWVAPLQ